MPRLGWFLRYGPWPVVVASSMLFLIGYGGVVLWPFALRDGSDGFPVPSVFGSAFVAVFMPLARRWQLRQATGWTPRRYDELIRAARRGELPSDRAELELLRKQVHSDQRETRWVPWLLPGMAAVGAGVALLNHRSFPGHLELLAAGWYLLLGAGVLALGRRRRRRDRELAGRLGGVGGGAGG